MSTSNLPACMLCRTKPADKTNSHIFSWFLIRDLVNKRGVKERDNEVVFLLDGQKVTAHVGRDQSAEEKAMPIKGRALTEAEIKHIENYNPFTRDHFLCSECEKKLSALESAANEMVVSKLRKHMPKAGTEVEEYPVKEGDLLRLFVYSLVWRAAAVSYQDYKMNPEHMEQLRQLLLESLDLDRKVMLERIAKCSGALRKISIVFYYLQTIGENTNLIACSDTVNPYSALVNDLGFQLFFDEATPDRDDPLFRDIFSIVDHAAFMAKNEELVNIAFINDASRKIMLGEIYRRQGRLTLKEATIKFGIQFFLATGLMPGRADAYAFQQNLLKRSDYKVENYTEEDQQQAINETLQQMLRG